MLKGNSKDILLDSALEPLSEMLQLGGRVHKSLLDSILTGQLQPGMRLRPDIIARSLEVSTTPVREALHQLGIDGLVVKVPYQGWIVREFSENQIRELYEFRAALERCAVHLACQRITDGEIQSIQRLHSSGVAALKSEDMDAYRLYNHEFHAAILKAAGNSYLTSAMDRVALQTETLAVQTIRILGRPLRAIEEHVQILDRIKKRQARQAEALMEEHILSALDDIVQSNHQQGKDRQSGKRRS